MTTVVSQLAQWEQHCLNRLLLGHTALCAPGFSGGATELQRAVAAGLAECQTREQVRIVFVAARYLAPVLERGGAWDESQHPRDQDGKWTHGANGRAGQEDASPSRDRVPPVEAQPPPEALPPPATATNTPGGLQVVVREQENRIRQRRRESGHAYDAGGNLILERDSPPDEPYKYVLSNEDIVHLRGKNVTLVHNHPRAWEYPGDDPRRAGNAFSEADMRVACRIEAAEYRAVSPGYRFSLKPPPEGWN